ncbi:MAG: cation transporter, partial [Blautia sp.]|nr:cation transporter [Blautia sp.]
FCVVSNALRLNLFKMYDAKKDKNRAIKNGANVDKQYGKNNSTMNDIKNDANKKKQNDKKNSAMNDIKNDANKKKQNDKKDSTKNDIKNDANMSKQNDNSIDQNGQKNKKNEKEIMTMEKTMEIKGMMCGHCEATVKKALEELTGVLEAIVSHEKGTALVKVDSEVADDVLKKAVEDKDYEVVSIS